MEMDVNKVVSLVNKHINSHGWLLAITLAPLDLVDLLNFWQLR